MGNVESENRELSKSMLQEIEAIIEKGFEKQMVVLRAIFMTKDGCSDEHKTRDKVYEGIKEQINKSATDAKRQFNFVVVISIIALFVAALAMGMKIEEALLKLIGMLK